MSDEERRGDNVFVRDNGEYRPLPVDSIPLWREVDGEPVPWPNNDVAAWARWYETNDRIVKRTTRAWMSLDLTYGYSVVVSTVFTGIDHNFSGLGRPKLYQLLVLTGTDRNVDPGDRHEEWFSTRAQALAGHDRIVRAIDALLDRGVDIRRDGIRDLLDELDDNIIDAALAPPTTIFELPEGDL